MSLPIRPIFTPSPQNETPVPMEQLWNSRMVYFVVGFAVGAIATYFINKIWNVRETDSTETKKSPLSERATTPTIPLYLHPIGQVAEEFRTNFEKVFGIFPKNSSSLNFSERIELILRNSSQSEYFNLPDFFKNDKEFIGLYLASKQRTGESEEKALRIANDHLKWLLTKDALFTLQRIEKENKIHIPKSPLLLEFSSLAGMEEAAGQIDQWMVTQATKLSEIQTLNLKNLGLISVPDFIGQLYSLEKLYLQENQLFAIPLSLTHLPKNCTITIDKQLDLSSFNEEVGKIRLTCPHLGPKIIYQA